MKANIRTVMLAK